MRSKIHGLKPGKEYFELINSAKLYDPSSIPKEVAESPRKLYQKSQISVKTATSKSLETITDNPLSLVQNSENVEDGESGATSSTSDEDYDPAYNLDNDQICVGQNKCLSPSVELLMTEGEKGDRWQQLLMM